MEMVLFDRTLIKEVASAPESRLSFSSMMVKSLQIEYIFGKEAALNQYHATVLKSQLTHLLPELIPAMVEELFIGFSEDFKDVGYGSPAFVVY